MLDTAPLLSPADPDELRAYRRGCARVSGPPVRVRPCLGGVSYTALLTVSAALTVALASAGADARLIALGAALSAGAAVGALVCARATAARTCLLEYRLAAFAARNGLVYERGADEPSLPGLRFSDGGGRALRRFRGEIAGAYVEAGNYRHADGTVSGYLLTPSRMEIVDPFDFSSPAEWHRAWRLLSA